MVMLSGYVIQKMPIMQKGILGARCGFGSTAEQGGLKAPRCSFGVLKCSSEAQNGHEGIQVHPNSAKCALIVPNTSLTHLESAWT